MQTSNLFPDNDVPTRMPLAAGRIAGANQTDALGQSMVDRWLENDSRRNAALNAGNVPRDEFLPRAIHIRRRFRARFAYRGASFVIASDPSLVAPRARRVCALRNDAEGYA
jgi:hypothetical protein